jgi:hypothetical protein
MQWQKERFQLYGMREKQKWCSEHAAEPKD